MKLNAQPTCRAGYRREASRIASVAVLLAAAMINVFAGPPSVEFRPQTGKVVMTSGSLELVVETNSGLNACSLRDLKSGRAYADTDYVWPNGQFPKLEGAAAIVSEKDGSCSVTFTATVGPLEIMQTFSASGDEPNVITEVIGLRNPTKDALDTSSFGCGLGKRLWEGTSLAGDFAESRFCNVPYRRHTETGELCDYTTQDLLKKQSWYSTARSPMYDRRTSAVWGAEGWAWYQGNRTLLISKYNSDEMEWSLLSPERRGNAEILRFGGAGRWKLGDPEGAARLAPLSRFTFGPTRYEVLDGDWRAGYAAFRRFTESKGNRLPPNFDPPVHWNELYDNPLWDVKGDTLANRQAYYRRNDMKLEADKGRELGCQCLYLDPGWDTEFGSTIWADDRLGTEENFVSWLKNDYGMRLALHTPLAPWNSAGTYPPSARMMNKDGGRAPDQHGSISDLCTASSAYIETKAARLKELCRNGAYFLMFDGSWYPGPCWDPAHGHSVPMTHQDHLNAVLKIEQMVHEAYPNVLIEQHDPMLGPGTPRYVPTYFLHDKPGAFDELWGFEYMAEPMEDILTRRAFSLYYYNLAYSIPIYLHIRLNRDNANAMMLWWYASTCRHLGVGAKPSDPAVWEAQKRAMKTYLSLKRFYTQGVFYGLDETIHAHTLPEINECVIDCFNLNTKQDIRHVKFRLSEVGLTLRKISMEGGSFTADGDEIEMAVAIPPMGHQLVRIRPAEPTNLPDGTNPQRKGAEGL